MCWPASDTPKADVREDSGVNIWLQRCTSAAVTVDGTQLKLPDNWFEDSWTYDCAEGGSVTVLWQLYRPLLGNTVEITTGRPYSRRPVLYSAGVAGMAADTCMCCAQTCCRS